MAKPWCVSTSTPASGRGFLAGDAVNTAARLQAAAPPMNVAVGALTRQLTERVIVFKELPPVAAKGKAELVAAWLALTPIARTGILLGTGSSHLSSVVAKRRLICAPFSTLS